MHAPEASLVALNRHKLEREQGNKSKKPPRAPSPALPRLASQDGGGVSDDGRVQWLALLCTRPGVTFPVTFCHLQPTDRNAYPETALWGRLISRTMWGRLVREVEGWSMVQAAWRVEGEAE